MFSGFHVNLDCEFFSIWEKDFSDYNEKGKKHLAEYKKKCCKTIDAYAVGEVLSARRMEEEWFPEIDVDVFLSHSRTDKELVEAFAGWLEDRFGLKCFIDSHVWSHVDSLIKLLYENYGEQDVSEYQKCSEIFSHAYMILSVALQKMIDKAEAVFLVNAGGALSSKNATRSPWIFSEITCTNLVRRKPLIAYRSYPGALHEHWKEKMNLLLEHVVLSYDLDLTNLEYLDIDKLKLWDMNYTFQLGDYSHSLDALYEITGYKDILRQTKLMATHLSASSIQKIQNIWHSSSRRETPSKSMQLILESMERIREDGVRKECERYHGCRWCSLGRS